MTSTAEMLAVSLLEGQAVEGRVTVSLFHTPALRSLLKRCAARLAPLHASLRGRLPGMADPGPCPPNSPLSCATIRLLPPRRL